MYAPTPNRLARQRSSDEKNSTTSEDESDNLANGNHRSRSDEVAVYCRLRPLPTEECEVSILYVYVISE